MISYEVSLGLILMNVILCVGSLNISHIIDFQEHVWLIFPLFPLFVLFFISALAESNRPPFDLLKLRVIVAGYNVEYSSLSLHFFILANMLILSYSLYLLQFSFSEGGIFHFCLLSFGCLP
jgi:NADH-quinone oxidoreductase subunit H